MADFPTLPDSSTNDNDWSPPFIYLKLKERYPFRAEPPGIGHYREYPPGRNQSRVIANVSVTGFDVYFSLLLRVQSRGFSSKFYFPELSVSYLQFFLP